MAAAQGTREVGEGESEGVSLSFRILGEVHRALKAELGPYLGAVEPGVGLSCGPLGDLNSEAPRINLFFHEVQLNKNGARGRPTVRARGDRGGDGDDFTFHPPPLELALRFLVTATAADPGEALEALGRALHFFQEHPRLLLGEGGEDGEAIPLTPDPDLDGERIAAIFRAHRAVPQLSVGYLTRVELHSTKVLRRAAATRSVSHRIRRPG